ncbi:hypothetical protein WOLCODRAFT_29284 [Wolfiporia cocos MD-104 SS10]|uniref:t-SNARE coiled-coil homology domain-containing protein n=1 Tax=Wolfiporia cocos (strain MD-104) TaxID=742152 RepID=A0A2H3J9S4_WOLCO|nr:hypothetical protein WOLCODRAFT_29284 [Wolfiporia cocos MD-104 SS10]
MSSLAKLTSLSTQTLSLLLERQRLQTLANPNASSLHIPQIARNMQQLRAGVLELQEKEGRSETVSLLRSQYERMRGMLGQEGEAAGVESLADEDPFNVSTSASASASTLSLVDGSAQAPPPAKDYEPAYTPYTDDPEAGYSSTEMLQAQRQMMDEQDVHLDRLSQSINRQRDLSLQINDELDVHTGLLEDLDHELDGTGSRLTGARRRLDRVARGTRENGSTVMIALLILVLLILIIVFKT